MYDDDEYGDHFAHHMHDQEMAADQAVHGLYADEQGALRRPQVMARRPGQRPWSMMDFSRYPGRGVTVTRRPAPGNLGHVMRQLAQPVSTQPATQPRAAFLGNMNMGALKGASTADLTRRIVQRAASGMALKPATTALIASNPQVARSVEQAAQLREMTSPTNITAIRAQGATITSTTIGENVTMSVSDCRAASTAIGLTTHFQPFVFPFAVVGATLVADIGGALTAAGLAVGTPFRWVGSIIEISASTLNLIQQIPFTVALLGGNGLAMNWTAIAEGPSRPAKFTNLNAQLFAGRVSLNAPTPVAANLGVDTITITGLPVATYTAQLRLLTPGDAEVDAFRSQLG